MGDRTGTKTSLVGENTAGKAFFHAGEHGAYNTAGDSLRIERTLKNSRENAGNVLDIDYYNAQAEDDIKHSHKGNELLRYSTDTLNTAEQDKGNDNGDDDTNDQAYKPLAFLAYYIEADERGIDGGGNGIDLSGVAGSEHGKHTKDSVKHRKEVPTLMQAVLYVVHGTADIVAVSVSLTEMHSQRNLRKLGAHTKQSGYPHPENSTGAANGDSPRYTGYIAGTDSCRQSGTHRLKRRDSALACLALFKKAADCGLDSSGELAELDEPGSDTEENTNADNTYHGGNAPNEIVYGAIYF